MEKYIDIQEYEGLYQVSNLGNVKSLRGNRVLLPQINNWGYYRVTLCKNGKTNRFQVHRLVAQAFIPNPDNLPEINHKDENPKNNCVDNLEWCTNAYNARYGTRGEKISKANINHPSVSKPVLCVETGIVYPSTKEAARQLDISHGDICNSCNGKRKTCGGYHWRYAE